MNLTVSHNLNEETQHVVACGEIDVSNASELRAEIEKALSEGSPRRLEVDLSEVAYIDSTGIGVLVGSAARAREEKIDFALIRPQKNVARILKLLRVDDELNVKD